MTFQEAVDGLRDGRLFTRWGWGVCWNFGGRRYLSAEGPKGEIWFHERGKEPKRWTPTLTDFLTNDWGAAPVDFPIQGRPLA